MLFRDEVKRVLASKEFAFLVKFDLAGYYVVLGHHELTNEMESWGVCPPVRKAFEAGFLGQWSGGTGPSRGIPQQLDASAVLANAFLARIDVQISHPERRYLRFMDDYFVFCKTASNAQACMGTLWRESQALHLPPSTAKVNILSAAEAALLVDAESEEIAAIDYGLSLGQQRVAIDVLQAAFDNNVHLVEDFNERHFRKHVNQFRTAQSDYAVAAVLERCESMPWAADIFSLYLKRYAHRTDVRERLLSSVNGEFGKIHLWASAKYLWCLEGPDSKMHPDSETTMLQIATRVETPWPVRTAATMAIARRGSTTARRGVQGIWTDALELPMQKAIVSCAARLPTEERGRQLRRWRSSSPDIAVTVDWLNRGR